MVESMALANIVRVDITTEEDEPKKYTLIEVASDATANAFLSAGQEQELRVGNTIHAQNNTKDIVKGYDITFTMIKAVLEVLALIDGGKWDEDKKTYEGAVAGEVTNRTLFTMDIYQEDKDYNSENKGYVKYTFKHCEGTPLSWSIKDGEFSSPQATIKARPRLGENVIEFAHVKELPVGI